MDRRCFVTMTGAAAIAAMAPALGAAQAPARRARFRTGLVAYSYRQALQSKAMKYEDLINVAVDTGTDGIDLTVYWLPSTDAGYLRSLRRLAYRNRVEIYSIGTRVQLAQPTPELREKQLADLRQWVEVAQRVGATHIRVFGGQKPAGATLEQAIGFAAETLKQGAEIAGANGVLLGIEDDGGITDFAKETIEIVSRAGSPYAGMNLDNGNFRPFGQTWKCGGTRCWHCGQRRIFSSDESSSCCVLRVLVRRGRFQVGFWCTGKSAARGRIPQTLCSCSWTSGPAHRAPRRRKPLALQRRDGHLCLADGADPFCSGKLDRHLERVSFRTLNAEKHVATPLRCGVNARRRHS